MADTGPYLADLHIHSPFSRATSKAGHLHGLAAWAAVKGIRVVGTGDFTHPEWFGRISEHLEEAEPGFFRLRDTDPKQYAGLLPPGVRVDVGAIRFVLTAEISSIYKRGGKVRKIHNILFAPDLASVRRINTVLAGIGNLESDGRPILGLDSRDLLEILLEQAPGGFLVPAHIWTPWFSLFGSKSGFDTIEECFGDLSDRIFALETGLSSDPDMNRMISALDRFTLISNSDCHSPGKLGREVNIFSTGFDYFAMRDAMKDPVDSEGRQRFAATVEFYPEEGKYHGDGHRKCGVSLEPAETRKLDGICPVCERPLTVGVLYRVMELADRDAPLHPPGSPKVHSLVPLPELLSELLGVGPATKKVAAAYGGLINRFGSEFSLLLDTPLDVIEKEGSPVLAEAVKRIRTGRVIRQAGFDGEFGIIKVFAEQELQSLGGQLDLFGNGRPVKRSTRVRRGRLAGTGPDRNPVKKKIEKKQGLNPEQEQVVASRARHLIVRAGPGTGKTHCLVNRVARLLREGDGPCTVITFTNRAADELRERITALVPAEAPVMVATLHGYCLHHLAGEVGPDAARPASRPRVAGPARRRWFLRNIMPGKSAVELKALDDQLSRYLQEGPDPAGPPALLRPYFARLRRAGLIDLEAVVPELTALLVRDDENGRRVYAQTGILFVDEFQDLNRNQYCLIRMLAEHVPVFVIGDPDQAIYGFRGSSPEWFFRFSRELAAEQHLLYRNYRNSDAIIKAATAVIEAGDDRSVDRRTMAVSREPAQVYLRQCATPGDEAAFVVRRIEQLLGGTSHREIERLRPGGGRDLGINDIAVLYRTGRQAEVVAEALAGQGLPCQVVDIEPFYLRRPLRELTSWVLFCADLLDPVGFLALLAKEPGMGKAALAEVEELLLHAPVLDLDQLAASPLLSPRLKATLTGMVARRDEVAARAGKEDLKAALELLLPGCSVDPEAPETIRFLNLAERYDASLAAFAEHLQRYSDSVVYDERAEAVTLMTLHAAKGLEFDAVFMIGLEEGLLPLAPRRELSAAAKRFHLAEERRLFYVGMTRAARVLFLSHVARRGMHGEIRQQEPSSFLQAIPPCLLTAPPSAGPGKRGSRRVRQLSLF